MFYVEETPRCVGLSDFDRMITGAYTVMKSSDNFGRNYLYYFYLNLDTDKRLKPLYNGLRNTILKDNFFHLNLLNEAEIYNKIANPIKTDWPDQNDCIVYKSLEALSLFRITQIRTFILALLNKRNEKLISHADFCKMINQMEKFHFKYSAICALKMNIFEGKYSKTELGSLEEQIISNNLN